MSASVGEVVAGRAAVSPTQPDAVMTKMLWMAIIPTGVFTFGGLILAMRFRMTEESMDSIRVQLDERRAVAHLRKPRQHATHTPPHACRSHAPAVDTPVDSREGIPDPNSGPDMAFTLPETTDAEKIVDIGCDGVVVSNHGGRVLDGVPASFEMLPQIASVVSGRTKVLFDSGVCSGQDAFKALAAGADAVMIGRPYIWGLATCGALGVAHVLRLMRDEFEMTLALCGCPTPQAITRGHLQALPALPVM